VTGVRAYMRVSGRLNLTLVRPLVASHAVLQCSIRSTPLEGLGRVDYSARLFSEPFTPTQVRQWAAERDAGGRREVGGR
jgi:hypothetical protein